VLKTREQASIFGFMLGPRIAGIAKTFCNIVHKTPGDVGEKILQAYDINPSLSDKEGLYRILKFSTDINFFAPAIALAKGWSGKAYVYHFNEPNPWDGEWKGEAGHVLDVAYLFQNYNELLDDAQRQVAVTFAGDFIKFMNGKGVWATFGNKEGAQVYGPSGKGVTSEYVEGVAGENSGRRNTIYELAEDVGLDSLAGTWVTYLTAAD
jgi:carboxylesterase type B